MNPRYLMPILGGVCAVTAVALTGTFYVPELPEADEIAKKESSSIEAISIERRIVPEADDLIANHLFVKGRKVENMKSNYDLVIKGVYIGESERSVIFSLKSKPQANLLVWQSERESVINKITDTKDVRYGIIAFLKEWDIREVTLGGVSFENTLTGETELYEVEYTPSKKVADNALSGYGQGQVLNVNGTGATSVKKTSSSNNNRNTKSSLSSAATKQMGKNISSAMSKMSATQRKELVSEVYKAYRANATSGNNSNKNSKQKKR